MNKKLKNFIPAILFLGILILGNACTSESPRNSANNLEANNSTPSNTGEITTSAACLDLEQIKAAFPGSVAKQAGSNFTMDYEPQYKVLTIKGAVYSQFEDFRTFIDVLNSFRNENCLRMIAFEGKETGKEFRWCSNIDCSPKVPDQVKCTQNNIKELYKDVAISDQISGKKLEPAFNEGNDGKLVLKGQISDKSKDKLTSFLDGIQKQVGDCISTFSFSTLASAGRSSAMSKGFEWQICEYPDCECYGSCSTRCPCTKYIGNSNTNVNSNAP